MSCHNIGFSVHNPEDLRRALSHYRKVTCENCGSVEVVDTADAKVIDDMIIFRSLCVYCDTLRARSIRYYNPKNEI